MQISSGSVDYITAAPDESTVPFARKAVAFSSVLPENGLHTRWALFLAVAADIPLYKIR